MAELSPLRRRMIEDMTIRNGFVTLPCGEREASRRARNC
jgi:hypothetical protein